MKYKDALFHYIETTTGYGIQEKELTMSLPLYIQAGYDLWSCSLSGFGVVFAHVKDTTTDMRIHYNAVRKIEENCPCYVVLVFDSLGSRNINRLIEKRQSFVIIDKYVYMPFALMQMKSEKLQPIPRKNFQSLTPDADMILIGYLNKNIQSGFMISQIASMIDRDIRATSAALSILESFEYVRIEKQGRSKHIVFNSPEDVYDRLKEEGISPIKYVFYSDSPMLDHPIMNSGYSALSVFSTLMDERIPTRAMSSKIRMRHFSELNECEKENAQFRIEVWDRDPSIFAVDGNVNPLYVLRTLRKENDERTQYALELLEQEIMKKFEGNQDERN